MYLLFWPDSSGSDGSSSCCLTSGPGFCRQRSQVAVDSESKQMAPSLCVLHWCGWFCYGDPQHPRAFRCSCCCAKSTQLVHAWDAGAWELLQHSPGMVPDLGCCFGWFSSTSISVALGPATCGAMEAESLVASTRDSDGLEVAGTNGIRSGRLSSEYSCSHIVCFLPNRGKYFLPLLCRATDPVSSGSFWECHRNLGIATAYPSECLAGMAGFSPTGGRGHGAPLVLDNSGGSWPLGDQDTSCSSSLPTRRVQ